jgi:hypothetical protein
MRPALKQKVSGFQGNSAYRVNTDNSVGNVTVVAGADLYQSDFGILSLIPDRFLRSEDREVLILDPEYAALAYLRPFQTKDSGCEAVTLSVRSCLQSLRWKFVTRLHTVSLPISTRTKLL